MGLKVKDDIIVKPIYSHISNFRGDYAECRIGMQKCLYGLLDRRAILSYLQNINTYINGMTMRRK